MNTINDIKKLIEIDNELFYTVDDSFSKICNSISKTPIPKTLEIMTMIQTNINFIKNGIFNLALDENYYGCQILQRTLYENFIKHFYLFLQYTESKDDTPGKNYTTTTDYKEYENYLSNLNKKHQLENNEKEDIKSIIDDIFPKFGNLTKNEKNEITSQYSFFKMLNFVSSKIDNVKDKPNTILTNFPTDYAILSSFIHGGIHANRLVMQNAMLGNKIYDTLYKICKKTFFFYSFCLMNTFIVAGQYDKSLLKNYKTILSYLSKIGIKTNTI